MNHALLGAAGAKTVYKVECFDRDGKLKWVDEAHNLVVNAGLDDLLDKYFKGATYTAAHFVGLTSGTPVIAAADTMVTHAGWTEVVGYSQATRPAFTPGTVSARSVDNSAAKAEFSVNATITAGGLFLSTNSTKSGTTGTLYGAAAFSGGNKALTSGDTLQVTATATTAAA